MKIKIHPFTFLIFVLVVVLAVGCNNNNRRRNNISFSNSRKTPTKKPVKKLKHHDKVSKVVYYLENSESMCGYVNGYSQFVDVVSDLAEKPEFVKQNTKRDFYFVNGKKLELNYLGNSPAILLSKLNDKEYRKYGNIKFSNLNSMFQLALNKAAGDTISILISDAIYDVGKNSPKSALVTEGKETRSKFIKRLSTGDVQTIVIKLKSYFNGFYFPVKGGRVKLKQKRPYYVWIFGKSSLLNKYFPAKYIESLNGYSNFARFLKSSEFNIPYQVTTHENIGTFRFDKQNNNKLIDVKADRHGQGFQFTFATNFSSLPFSASYLSSISNYSTNNPNYFVKNVSTIGNVKIYGLKFKPTYLITVRTNKNPIGKLNISLLNVVPNWIAKTNINSEKSIINDSTHTYGFQYLTDGICQAYKYIDPDSDIVTFKFELLK